MTIRTQRLVMILAAVTAALTGQAARAQHDHDHEHADIVVGKTGAGQLNVEYDFDEAIGLPPVNGLLVGCAVDDPGFMSLDEDEPAEDFFMLPPGANVVFELVSIDPGLVVLSPGFIDILDMPGEQFTIGMPPFDVHPTFLIDGNHPAFDENGTYSLTFRLLDSNGNCLTSEDFTATFTCAALGACCLPDGECEEGESEEGCEEEGGTFLGADSTCTDADGDGVADCHDVCPGVDDAVFAPGCAGAIPTTSEWGLAVLGLLLVVAGKLFYGVRQTAA